MASCIVHGFPHHAGLLASHNNAPQHMTMLPASIITAFAYVTVVTGN